MAQSFTVSRVCSIEPALRALVDDASAEGFGFMGRLVSAWEEGSNRFDRQGEAYFAVWRGNKMVGAGGLNRDPYSPDATVGRVRHLFVSRSARRSGAGSALMRVIVEHARCEFDMLRLRTTTPRGAAFYEALGFMRDGAADASHILRF